MMALPISRELLVARLQRRLPQQVIRQRAGRRQRVFDRRQLFHLRRRARAIAVVEVVAEEVLVVGVVPGIGLFSRRLLGFGLLRLLLLGGLELFGRHLLEQGFSTISWFKRSDSSSVDIGSSFDRLLQRRRQNELLNELGVEPLLDRHERLTLVPPNLSPIGSRRRGKSA